MPTISQDNHDSLIQFFHQTRGSRQIGRNVSKGNSRVGRDLLGRSPSAVIVALVHVHNAPSTGGRASTSAASSPSAASSAGSRLRGWDFFLLGRGGRRRWHLLFGTRLHGDCGGFWVGMKKQIAGLLLGIDTATPWCKESKSDAWSLAFDVPTDCLCFSCFGCIGRPKRPGVGLLCV